MKRIVRLTIALNRAWREAWPEPPQAFKIPERYWPRPCPGAKHTITSRENLVEFFTPEHVAAFDRAKADGVLIPCKN